MRSPAADQSHELVFGAEIIGAEQRTATARCHFFACVLVSPIGRQSPGTDAASRRERVMHRSVLITGGAGYIGSRLAFKLAGQPNTSVVVLDNFRRGTPEALRLSTESVRLIRGDVRDADLLEDLTRDKDVVYHLAAESAVLSAQSNPDYCFSTNVTGTLNVLRAAKKTGARRVVFASSREVYGDAQCLPVSESTPLRPCNEYGASKASAEMYCQAFQSLGVDVTIVRLSNVYGPGDRGRVIPAFVERALADDPLTLFGARQVLDFVWIGIVIQALVLLGAERYISCPLNIASGKGVAITELADRIVAQSGSGSSVTIAPARESEVVRFVADTRAAQAALGLDPPDDPMFGLDEVIRAARAEKSRIERNLMLTSASVY